MVVDRDQASRYDLTLIDIVGRIQAHKGLDVAIYMLPHLPD